MGRGRRGRGDEGRLDAAPGLAKLDEDVLVPVGCALERGLGDPGEEVRAGGEGGAVGESGAGGRGELDDREEAGEVVARVGSRVLRE